jgi:hypothetical protein
MTNYLLYVSYINILIHTVENLRIKNKTNMTYITNGIFKKYITNRC